MAMSRQQQYESLNGEALELFKHGRFTEALARWSEARGVCRGYPIQEFSVLTWMAQCYESLRRPADALTLLEELAALKQAGGFRIQHELVDRIVALKRIAAASPPPRGKRPRKAAR